MTRKDYVLIAKILKESNDPHNYNGGLDSLIKWFAEDLAVTNPRFNREIFLKACGINCCSHEYESACPCCIGECDTCK